MANILLTNYCNRSCPYCFAMEKMQDKADTVSNGHQHMTLDDFDQCLAFQRRSGHRMVALLGGEPTLHPEFFQIMDRCRQDDYFTCIKLFTNGMMPARTVDFLAEFTGPDLSIALNAHPPHAYKPGQWRQIEYLLKRLGPKIGLGLNIYETGNDFRFLLDLFQEYGLRSHLRMGLTQPILGAENKHLPAEDFPTVAEEIVDAARMFSPHGFTFSFDCGFPFCMFSLEQHKELLANAVLFRSLCSPIIDIGPDLKVWRCFPLSQVYNRQLSDFNQRSDAEFYYRQKLHPYQQFGIYDRCLQCQYRQHELCSGGCLSRSLGQFHVNADQMTEAKMP